MHISRRKFLQMTGAGLVVAACAPSVANASPVAKSRSLAMNNLHTGEMLEACYFDGLSYVKPELVKLNHICRDFRRNEIHPMDKRLFDHISKIQSLLGSDAEVMIISGYRSPATNKMLRSRSNGVARKSYHMSGQAIDFRLDGVSLKRIRDAAMDLKMGGVGYYPRSEFVHIDTGPVRSWRG